ncbi:MAG: CRISPR-associated endonuclease Cas2 [Kiritimatiellae bacterium]|nr:CRISPR-associated endonuclease Cas2 [Kiritimatiellia bacterium]
MSRFTDSALYDVGIDVPFDPAQEPVREMLYLVAYDICSPRRLRHAASVCEDYGIRIEKSVFECDLSESQFASFWSDLNAEIDPEEDALVAYRICRSCVKETLTAGIVERPAKPLYYIF